MQTLSALFFISLNFLVAWHLVGLVEKSNCRSQAISSSTKAISQALISGEFPEKTLFKVCGKDLRPEKKEQTYSVHSPQLLGELKMKLYGKLEKSPSHKQPGSQNEK